MNLELAAAASSARRASGGFAHPPWIDTVEQTAPHRNQSRTLPAKPVTNGEWLSHNSVIQECLVADGRGFDEPRSKCWNKRGSSSRTGLRLRYLVLREDQPVVFFQMGGGPKLDEVTATLGP